MSYASSVADSRRAARSDHRWLILVIVAVAQLMVVLDATIVNIALPSAQHALGFPNGDRQWVVTAYALAFGSLLLVGGRLGDMFSRKWVFITGLAGFALSSALGGAAVSCPMLVAAYARWRVLRLSPRLPPWGPWSARSANRTSAAGRSASSVRSPAAAVPWA